MLVDDQILVYDNASSGKQPQRQFGQAYMNAFCFYNLIRILVGCQLGGAWTLVASGETSEDMEAAFKLGESIKLLSTKYTKLGQEGVSSSKIIGKTTN